MGQQVLVVCGLGPVVATQILQQKGSATLLIRGSPS